MRLILVRHGETQWNRENRVLGHTEIKLNEEGRKQVESVALALREEKVAAIYCSPLKRTRETAEAIARFHQVGVEVDEAFKEMDAGELDGLTYEEMRDRYGDFLREWIRDAASLRMPGGESLAQVQQRAWQGVEGIIDRNPEGVVIVVSHNFAILCIICRALGLDLSQFRRLRLNVASISILNFGGWGIQLELFNDTCHLEAGVD
ncbi:MAG: histidine phosphatase family protein [Dehalococcoidia bacterium]|nr:MAG: histidine phosphatase family protein [Dehalococcoidia bacterium]